MQPGADSNGHARSGIPIPVPSTVKKTQNLRMSMAGPNTRPPLLPPPPPSNPRQSMYRSQQAAMNPLLASASKPNFGRTPLQNNARRGSLWAGGAQSSELPINQPRKDMRPLRDRAFQAKLRQDVLSWLQSTGYDIDRSVLANITGRDYRSIIFHLVYLLDPGHLFNDKAKFEDEFVLLLKTLRYPFVAQIDPKWLAAPASMHAWPNLLAVLHWLSEMGKARLNLLGSGDPSLQDPSDVPDEFELEDHHRALSFDYTVSAYEAFMNGADVFEEQDKMLEDRYRKKDEKVIEDVDKQKEELDRSKIEYQRLASSAPPIKRLQKDNQLLKADMEKFRRILDQYAARRKKLVDGIAYEKNELVLGAQHLEQLKAEQERLGEVVKTQNLTAEEVIRMNAEHEQLQRNLEDLKQKISEAHRTVMTLEVNVTNRGAAAEEAVDAYNNLLSTLNLFPPLPHPWQNVDLTLELNTAAATPAGLLTGADIRRVIRPTLGSIAESKRVERAEVESERIKVDNQLDQLSLDCENMEVDIVEVEKKVMALNDQADNLRDAALHEAMVNSNEAARLERELVQARTAALANGMGVKSRLQAVQVQYREQLDKVARLKEETTRAILKSSTDLGLFKEEVSKHLKELRDFAHEG